MFTIKVSDKKENLPAVIKVTVGRDVKTYKLAK
jgi:hypothetical protein